MALLLLTLAEQALVRVVRRWRSMPRSARSAAFASFAAATLPGCTSWFFYPSATLVQTPADLGYDYRDVSLITEDDVRLHAWFVCGRGPTDAGRVLYLHGNAQNISWHLTLARWLLDRGFDVLALDYRGYGRSDGRPDVPEVFADLEAAADWLITGDRRAASAESMIAFEHLDPDPDHSGGRARACGDGADRLRAVEPDGPDAPLRLVFGQSLGASLALGWMSAYPHNQQRFDAMIAEAAFSRYATIGQEVAAGFFLTWPLQYPVRWALRNNPDPVDAIEAIDLPIVLVHSVDDAIVDVSHGRALARAAPPDTTRWIETRGPHIQAMRSPAIQAEALALVRAMTGREPARP